MRSALLGGAVALVLAGCAKISAPVGGEPDKEPPRVVATDPAQFAVLPGRSEPVTIRFDERISEKRIGESVLVSPETGAVRIRKGRSELRVTVEGGWRPGQVYRVVVLPVVQDLFGNTLKDEIELIFSTGPEIPATAVAGVLTDRLTGEAVTGARVEAISQGDSTTYVALSDTAGFFALRHIPAGSYTLRSFLDRNRNGKLDFGEPVDTGTVAPGAADTVIVSHALLPPDTTPARVLRAEAKDSMQVRIALDDHLDPQVPLAGVMVELRALPDSVPVAVARVAQVHEIERERAEERARADSARVDSARVAGAVVDSAGAVADSVGAAKSEVARARSRVAAGRPGGAGGEGEKTPAEPLPIRELVVVPEAPLAPGTRFWIKISGIRNINGVEGGGGSVVFETAEADEPDPPDDDPGPPASTLPDSAVARPPSNPPDSIVAPPPSTPPDTSTASPPPLGSGPRGRG